MKPLFCWSRLFPAAALIAVASVTACGRILDEPGGAADAPTDSGTDAASDSGLPDVGTEGGRPDDGATATPCTDGLKNGTETDVDCGGATCSACVAGRSCAVDGDCADGARCAAGVCVALPRVTALVSSSVHRCARFDSGVVVCWGGNGAGELGLGDRNNRGDNPGEMGEALPAVNLGTGRKALSVTASAYHTCAVLDDGAVKCWGRNDFGELGLGDHNGRGDAPGEMGDALPAVDLGTGRKALSVTAGALHTCALLDDGAVKCWGTDGHGELGLGGTNSRGLYAGEMGDALPAVNLGTGRKARAIAAGAYHTCALLDNGAVKCWGMNANGELGVGDGENRGDLPGEMGDALPAVNLGTGRTARAVTCSGAHACALLDNNTVKCWGQNVAGTLGLGDTKTRGYTATELGDNLPAVDLGTRRTAVVVSAAPIGNCALLDNGGVKCWGANFLGQLGLGDTNNRGDAPGQMGENLPAVDLGTGRTVRGLTANGYTPCAILDDGAVKCWGWNMFGQLGLGDTNDRGDKPGEMGDNLPAVDLGARVR